MHPASLRSLRNWRTAVACAGFACAGLACAAQLSLAPLKLESGSTGRASLRAAPLSRPADHAAGGLLSLPAAARLPISAALGASDHAYWVGAGGHPPEAVNRAQRLRVRFERAGVLVSSRGMRLRIGPAKIAGQAAAGATGAGAAGETPSVSANRATYRRGTLSEWYLNGPLGLEQGFTMARAPAAQDRRTLTLSLALAGNARAQASAGGERVTFSRAGSPPLAYSGLSASDARGRSLPASMTLDGGALLLHVDTAGARYPVTVDPLLALSEPPLTGTEETPGGQFGYSVALSADGNTALIGGPDDKGGLGAAWAFTRSGSSWSQQGPKLTPGSSEPSGGEACPEEPLEESEECGFGRSVSLSYDGNTALIGAPRAQGAEGSAWVFTRSTQTGTWSIEAHIITSPQVTGTGRFGRSVALSADGGTALIGSPGDQTGHGTVSVYTHPAPGFWVRSAKLLPPDAIGAGYFGRSVALSGTGTTALIGEPGENHLAGTAWVYTGAGSSWSVQQELTAADEVGKGHFGYSVSLSGPGNTALVSGRTDNNRQGAAWVFTRSGTTWTQQGAKLVPSDEAEGGEFGMSTALSANGETALVGTAHNDEKRLGAAWVFTRSGSAWKQQGTKITPKEGFASAWFGAGVALSAGGTSALVGGPMTAMKTGAAWELDGISVPAPVVESVTPAAGPATGGTAVTIEGSGFTVGATVTIGSVASNVKVVSEHTITATTSATTAGAYEVVVSDASGTSAGGPSFSYEAVPVNKEEQPQQPPATQNLGTSSLGSLGVLSNITSVPGPPVLGVNGNLAPISGTASYELPGTHTFVPLTGLRQVPFGTVIDARHGRVKITTVGPHGVLQTVELYEGEFMLTQDHSGRVLITLVGGNFSVCPTARQRAHHASASARTSARRTSRKHLVRKLWANGKGSYTTKGNYASGAVLGTRWVTEDRCNSTWIHVATDRVRVTNLINGKHKTVRAGRTYKAILPG